MEIVLFLLPLALIIGVGFLLAYFWAVKTGQYDDMTTPSYRILLDEEDEKKKVKDRNSSDDSETENQK